MILPHDPPILVSFCVVPSFLHSALLACYDLFTTHVATDVDTSLHGAP